MTRCVHCFEGGSITAPANTMHALTTDKMRLHIGCHIRSLSHCHADLQPYTFKMEAGRTRAHTHAHTRMDKCAHTHTPCLAPWQWEMGQRSWLQRQPPSDTASTIEARYFCRRWKGGPQKDFGPQPHILRAIACPTILTLLCRHKDASGQQPSAPTVQRQAAYS